MLTKIVVLLAVFLVAGIQCKAVGPNDDVPLNEPLPVPEKSTSAKTTEEELEQLVLSIWGLPCITDLQCSAISYCDRSVGISHHLSLGNLDLDGQCRPSYKFCFWLWILGAAMLFLVLCSWRMKNLNPAVMQNLNPAVMQNPNLDVLFEIHEESLEKNEHVSHDEKHLSHDEKLQSHDEKLQSHDEKHLSHDVKLQSHDEKHLSQVLFIM